MVCQKTWRSFAGSAITVLFFQNSSLAEQFTVFFFCSCEEIQLLVIQMVLQQWMHLLVVIGDCSISRL